MGLDELLRPRETEMTRTVKARKSEIIAGMEAKGDADAMFTVQEAIADYADRMEGKYPNLWDKVEAYHALIGSGLKQGTETIPDFPNAKDSVEAFLETLANRSV
ncbi:hypothetical protein HY418_02405 [Candidatus Kaiserbacteria bacterium]|nr:hypothetical protein [Candidatus Kaiserbacteria bacterium]